MQIKQLFQANNTPATSHLYNFNTGIATPERSIMRKPKGIYSTNKFLQPKSSQFIPFTLPESG